MLTNNLIVFTMSINASHSFTKINFSFNIFNNKMIRINCIVFIMT